MNSELIKAIEKKENERSFLLKLNSDIAAVRNKQELLATLCNNLKEVGFYSNPDINILNESRTAFTPFIPNTDTLANRIWHMHSGDEYICLDGMFELILNAEDPLFFDVAKLITDNNVPEHIKHLHQAGVREIAVLGLRDHGKYIGGILFFSEEVKVFTHDQLLMVKEIGRLTGIAIANILFKEDILEREKEKEFLLSVSYDIARTRNRDDLLRVINHRLKTLFDCSHCGIGVINRETNSASVFLRDPESVTVNDDSFLTSFKDYHIDGNDIISETIGAQRTLIFDLEEENAKGRLPAVIKKNLQLGIKEMIAVPLSNEYMAFAVLCLFAKNKGNFNNRYFKILDGVGSQMSIAVANIIANERLVEREKEKSLLLSVSKDITACRSKNEFLNVINYKLKNLINAKDVVISVLNDEGKTHSAFLYDATDAARHHHEYAEILKQKYLIADGVFEKVLASTNAVMLDFEELLISGTTPPYIDFFYKNGIRQGIAIPLIENSRAIGGIFMYMEKKIAAERYPLSLLQGIASQIAIAVSNIRAYEKIQQQLKEIDYYKALLEEENQYLHQQIKTVFDDNNDMIGHAGGLKEVSNLISRVAASDTTVLILGETGTGKELVARALHNASPRKDKLIIKVNCAALPASLIESELFGHEKGSFTGATERRIGKFELANNGTLFLDEIGELALELQVKLLRALQEKEIERIGGKEVIKTNVRIIAATNRNLHHEVEAGRFRSDLYYRLNVFPITIPALKERSEDIPVLVSHFMNKLSGRLGKNIQNIGTDAMNALMAHTWPGNVRELEHVIERSALMAKDSTIREVYMPNNSRSVVQARPEVVKIKSLDESERDHIRAILMRCNGKIKGVGGAAELLGLPPTTLHSKMKKLGIAKDDY